MRESFTYDASHAAPPLTPATRDDLVHADMLALLFRQAFPAVFQSFLVASCLCWTLWGRIDSYKLLVWLCVLGASTLVRLALYLLYFRAKPVGRALLAWERPYAATLLLSSLTWGLGAVWLMPPNQMVEQGVILIFVVGLVGGGVYTYCAHRGMTIAAMSAVLLPSTVWLFLQPGRMSLGIALAASTFMIGALRGTKVLAMAMTGSQRLGYELQQANRVADHMARTDELTGINNRRSFVELGEQTSHLCHRQSKPLSALLIDVDHFKQINDTYGHSAGDRVLQQVGTMLAQQFRSSDVCGRIGGEEFAVLLADTDTATATAIAEKLRLTVSSASVLWQEQTLRITVSIGVATHSGHLGTLLQLADAAMYQAKAGGRNRVNICQSTS